MSDRAAYQFHWVWDLSAAAEKVWPLVSDTNRFNRDTGLPTVVDGRAEVANLLDHSGASVTPLDTGLQGIEERMRLWRVASVDLTTGGRAGEEIARDGMTGARISREGDQSAGPWSDEIDDIDFAARIRGTEPVGGPESDPDPQGP